MCTMEMSNSGTDSSFQLQNTQVTFPLFVGTDTLLVGDDFHFQFMMFDHTFDGFQVEPNIVCVEILELFNTLEFFNMIGRDLSDFQESDCTLVVDDGTP